MKCFILIVLVVLASPLLATAQDSVDLKGSWNLKVETPQGEYALALKLEEVTAEKLTGTLEAPQGNMAVTGKLDGQTITFTANFDANGRSILLEFTGKVDGNKMSGTADFGGMGSGSWSAEKAAARILANK